MGDAHGGLFERGAKAFLAFVQDRLHLLAFCDVTGNGGDADDLARVVADRRDHERDVDLPPVFAPAPGFELPDAIAHGKAADDARLLGNLGRREQA